MNAVDFLESQHREVEKLFEQIEKTKDSGAGRERKALFNEIAKKLTDHTKIEEKIFYPAGKKVDSEMTLEAFEEHDLVKNVIKKLVKTRANDEAFMVRIAVLKELVEHHVKEEEHHYFPECKRKLGEERLEALGEELEDAFAKLEKRAPKRPKLQLAKAS